MRILKMDKGCDSFFKAVSDPNRVKIMDLLKKKEMCVSEICEEFNMKQPSISHHLNILKNAGIVNSRKEGKEVYYSLDDKYVCDCCFGFIEKFKE